MRTSADQQQQHCGGRGRELESAQVRTEAREGVELVSGPDDCSSNHWLSTLRLTAKDSKMVENQRLEILESAHSIGLLLRPIWKPLHTLPMYESCSRSMLDVAEDQALRLISLPSSPQLVDWWDK